jgi:pimeloyl-ACP methyl ester carboxylesterase
MSTARINLPAVYYRKANAGGMNIFYREAGEANAPALLLLHGFPTSSHMFRGLIPLLADRYHLVAPDLPGSASRKRRIAGHSITPSIISPASSTISRVRSLLGPARYMFSITARRLVSALRSNILNAPPLSFRKMATPTKRD